MAKGWTWPPRVEVLACPDSTVPMGFGQLPFMETKGGRKFAHKHTQEPASQLYLAAMKTHCALLLLLLILPSITQGKYVNL